MIARTFGNRLAPGSAWLRSCHGWQAYLVAFLTGLASAAAMAPLFLSPILFLTLPVLLILIMARVEPEGRDGVGPTPLQAVLGSAIVAWWFGFGFHFAGLYWIGFAFLVQADAFAWLLPFAVTLLPAGLALFHGLAGAITALLIVARARGSGADTSRVADHIAPVVALALALSVTEWVRGTVLTGFPWNALGYALTWPLQIMQTAGLFGIFGLTLISVLVFGAPYIAVGRATLTGRQPTLAIISVVLIFVPLVGGWIYGGIQLAAADPDYQSSARLRLVQPSIPQKHKFRHDLKRAVFEQHIKMSMRNPKGETDRLAGITHVIWPEAAMPFLPLETPEAMNILASVIPKHTTLIAGALRRQRGVDGKLDVYNSVISFGEGGRVIAIYDKNHLVPFGEYLPFQTLLERIGLESLTRQRGGFAAGPAPRPLLTLEHLPLSSVLICYEVIFPAASVSGPKRPAMIINVTNDAWFGHSTGPYQHFHQARLRAVEQGLPLIRVANNGLSGVVDSRGRLVHVLGLNVKGVIDTSVPGVGKKTLYAVYGDAIFWSLWIGLLVIFCAEGASRTLTRRSRPGAHA